jgi:hypothetical protein
MCLSWILLQASLQLWRGTPPRCSLLSALEEMRKCMMVTEGGGGDTRQRDGSGTMLQAKGRAFETTRGNLHSSIGLNLPSRTRPWGLLSI